MSKRMDEGRTPSKGKRAKILDNDDEEKIEAIVQERIQEHFDKMEELELERERQATSLPKHPEPSRLMAKLKITEHHKYAYNVGTSVLRSLYDKSEFTWNGEAAQYQRWSQAMRSQLRMNGLDHATAIAERLEHEGNKDEYLFNKSKYIHEDDRKMVALIIANTLNATARERMTSIDESGDGTLDGVLYLAHFHERFGTAKLVTVQSSFDKILAMISSANEGKTTGIAPTTSFSKLDQHFNAQFSGKDALKWLKVMFMCRVIDRNKYDTVLKDLDLKRTGTGPPDEHEIIAACTAVHDREALDSRRTAKSTSPARPAARKEQPTATQREQPKVMNTTAQQSNNSNKAKYPCKRCSTNGKPQFHFFKDCPKVECRICKKKGHISSACPDKNSIKDKEPGAVA